MTLIPDDPRHGTHNGYSLGCRCEPCRQAMRIVSAKWYAKNAERARERQAKYYAENPEKRQASTAKYYARNSEKLLAKSAKWRAENTEKVRATTAKWRAENPDKIQAKKARRHARKLAQWVESVDYTVVWDRDGGVCHICGLLADPADWHLDHIVPIVLGGEHSYANTAVSHSFCNLSKGAQPSVG